MSRNGGLLNYDRVGNLSQVKRSTVQNYYQILRDTLIGADLMPFKTGKPHSSVKTNKFYFFDGGIVNALKNQREILSHSTEYGWALEAFIYHELKSYCDYAASPVDLNFWRSLDDYEVDFVLNGKSAIEVKATRSIQNEDLRALRALRDVSSLCHFYVICHEPKEKIVDGIHILSVEIFLKRLWAGDIAS